MNHDLNTSHVKVNQQTMNLKQQKEYNLNTSHVKVNRRVELV